MIKIYSYVIQIVIFLNKEMHTMHNTGNILIKDPYLNTSVKTDTRPHSTSHNFVHSTSHNICHSNPP